MEPKVLEVLGVSSLAVPPPSLHSSPPEDEPGNQSHLQGVHFFFLLHHIFGSELAFAPAFIYLFDEGIPSGFTSGL